MFILILAILISIAIHLRHTRQIKTLWQGITMLAVGFCCIEAGLNHIGLEHLNAEYALAPDWALWPACFFISLVNVFASFGFARTLRDHRVVEPITNPARQLAELRWKKAG